MSNVLLNDKNTDTQSINHEEIKKSPYFVEVYNSGNKKLRIPCVNQSIANKVLASINRLSENKQQQLLQ